jgi:hypothetical protein
MDYLPGIERFILDREASTRDRLSLHKVLVDQNLRQINGLFSKDADELSIKASLVA